MEAAILFGKTLGQYQEAVNKYIAVRITQNHTTTIKHKELKGITLKNLLVTIMGNASIVASVMTTYFQLKGDIHDVRLLTQLIDINCSSSSRWKIIVVRRCLYT